MSSRDEYYCTKCGAILNDQWGFDPDKGSWICTKCGHMMMADDVYAGKQFEGVAWICDDCGALLNRQPGFSDTCKKWKCTECGCVNGITSDDIIKYQCPKCYNPLDIQPGFVNGLNNWTCTKCYTNLKFDLIYGKYVEDVADDSDDKNDSEDNNHSYGGGFFSFKEFKENWEAVINRKETPFEKFTRIISDIFTVIKFVLLIGILIVGGYFALKWTGQLDITKNSEDHPDEVEIVRDAEHFKGKNYYNTIIKLQEGGLGDINITPLNDLEPGIFTKAGKIETIEVDGISDFDAYTWFSKDSVVNISYHSIIKKEKNGFDEEKNSHLIFGGMDIQLPSYLVEDSNDTKRAVYHVKGDKKTQLTILLDDNDHCNEISGYDSYYLLHREECIVSSLSGEKNVYLGKNKLTVFNIQIITIETNTESQYLHLIFASPDKSKMDYDSDFNAIVSGIYVPKETEIRLDFNPKDYKGKKYEEVVAELKEKGFVNIQVKNLEDVVIGVFTKEGVVEGVTINGKSDYKSGEWIDKQTEILITYHGKK